jgi:hypothetical protein
MTDDLEQSGFSELDRLLELVRRTRELLDAVVDDGVLPEGGAAYLAERTLPHLEGAQAGFHGWLRSEAAGALELQYLLRQVAAMRVEPAGSPAERRAEVIEAALERSLTAATRRGAEALQRAEPWNLAALAHARVVLAFIPRLPETAVRFPAGRRTYADIPTPRGPAELASRLTELEAQLWRTAAGRPPAAIDPAFRRTYGFFDVADRLGARALGGTA